MLHIYVMESGPALLRKQPYKLGKRVFDRLPVMEISVGSHLLALLPHRPFTNKHVQDSVRNIILPFIISDYALHYSRM